MNFMSDSTIPPTGEDQRSNPRLVWKTSPSCRSYAPPQKDTQVSLNGGPGLRELILVSGYRLEMRLVPYMYHNPQFKTDRKILTAFDTIDSLRAVLGRLSRGMSLH